MRNTYEMAHEGNYEPIGRLSPAPREIRGGAIERASRETLIEGGPIAGRR